MEKSCSICMEEEDLGRPTKCGHLFCKPCMKDWIHQCLRERSIIACPTCRTILHRQYSYLDSYQDIPIDQIQGYAIYLKHRGKMPSAFVDHSKERFFHIRMCRETPGRRVIDRLHQDIYHLFAVRTRKALYEERCYIRMIYEDIDGERLYQKTRLPHSSPLSALEVESFFPYDPNEEEENEDEDDGI